MPRKKTKRKAPGNASNEIFKAIRAFNERLRVTEKKYGKDSRIVKMMIDKAKYLPQLEWTKSGRLSRSDRVVKAVDTPYVKAMFDKFVKQNTVDKIIDEILTEKQKKELEEIKNASERRKKLENYVRHINAARELANEVFNEIYNLTKNVDDAKACYDAILFSNNYLDAIEAYVDGDLDVLTLRDVLIYDVPLEVALNRAHNGSSETDDDYPSIYHDDLASVNELFSDAELFDLFDDDDDDGIPF